MVEKEGSSVSHYLLSPARTLRDACRQTGHDDNGARCAKCPVKDLCENDDRWFVCVNSSDLEPH